MKAIKKQSTFLFLLGTLMISSPALVSCRKESTEMTLQEKETAKKEISDIREGISQSIDRLDSEAEMKHYLDSPDFLAISPDGSPNSYDTMKSHGAASLKQLAAVRHTTLKEDFRFLTKNHVLYTWFGKIAMELKTGERYIAKTYTITMLFSKVNNEWKVTYNHESATPPVKME